ncbi:DUF1835 domain-containing protein [Vibrio parahaemolyticus]|uniref:DUF1835 domain-containing protein n=1 Tax=Vibrio parahaemolyticus TaxID=670 RepID=UPI00084B6D81|nr:DUF1835 domain-containing protein [Vibrio parahaemolyticus]EGR3353449.1 DUF1835 domain-containing protein [Vibrio parahaemolyticus]EJG1848447.1 DUF1835 domain-containing protein [Vibrio parahaemolyticus]ODZ70710.1 hypothetical protein BBM46_21000 [Vibrio parahaemolyticus]OEA11421.1 hypothetical protein BBM54_14850 [Vibrio parahaemolyticus]
MQSHNSFSINLNQQKSVAIKRLKAIRQNDERALQQVRQFHTQPEKLTTESIQLADVQHALARELGLPSWSKLKAHVEELEFHKVAIHNQEQPLDSELKTLHVRCGHDIQQQLKTCGFEGEFLPMIDPLCIGPIPNDETAFVAIRAQYVVDTLLPVMGREGSVQDIALSEQNNINTLLDEQFKRIVFWVEHDTYDQFMLLRGLTLLEETEGKVIEIIEFNQFPGTERFIGFGQLPAEAVRSCWQHRKPVTSKLGSQAKLCWQALISPTPQSVIELLAQHDLDCLPNIKPAMKRHLQELPHSESGLSFTQQLALETLAEHSTPITVKDWFEEYQEKEPLPTLGDVMFYALLLPLTRSDKPLFCIDSLQKNWWEQQVCITEHAQACLEGSQPITQNYWVGGIQVQESNLWVWDHNQLSSLSHKEW